jgi:hypothetical protein
MRRPRKSSAERPATDPPRRAVRGICVRYSSASIKWTGHGNRRVVFARPTSRSDAPEDLNDPLDARDTRVIGSSARPRCVHLVWDGRRPAVRAHAAARGVRSDRRDLCWLAIELFPVEARA